MSLTYLQRSAWNARPSLGPVHLNANGLLGIGLHYPAMGDRHLFARDDVARALRGWQDYHMEDRGWSDIGYQVAVDQAGRPWNLRGLTTRSGANGNEEANEAYGAILLVVGNRETPTGALINTTRQVIADFRRIYPKATLIQPHSAIRVAYTGSSTECPGSLVRGLIKAGQFEPRTTTPGDVVTPAQMAEIKEEIQRWALWGALYEIETEDDRMAAADAYARAKAAGKSELDAMKAASAHLSTLRAALKKAQAEL